MNVGISVCVILAALSSSSLSLPSQSLETQRMVVVTESLSVPSLNHTRQTRSAPAFLAGRFTHYSHPNEDSDASNSLNQLLARLMPRRGSPFQSRSFLSSRAVAPDHRIKDRDYLGWMDFGRRSAEDYEYSP